MKEALYYEDIFLVPKYSTLNSRSEADTSVEFGKYKFKLPIIPSNMLGSISVDWAKWLSQNWYFYVMHRFDGVTVPFVKKANEENWNFISISTGVNDESLDDLVLIKNYGFRVDYITIDVAHGHHIKVKNCIQEIRNIFGNSVYIIAGNTSTPQSTVDLEDWGADATKCLIGTGCFTPESEVKTINGNVQIKNIKPGMLVLTHTGQYKEVLTIFKYDHFKKLRNINNNIKCTHSHKFYVVNKNDSDKITEENYKEYAYWVEAKNLNSNMCLIKFD
jgi:hypothetical protein